MEKEYTLLFNGITDAIEDIQELTQRLMDLQAQAEALYITREE